MGTTFLRSSFIYLSYFLYSFKNRFFNWVRVRIFKRHKSFSVIQHGYTNEDSIAIVAIWPRAFTIESLTRLLESLEQNRVHVVCVINKSKDATLFLNKLAKPNRTIIYRPNIGRDFGAYQLGYRYVKKHIKLDSVKKLTFANDSVYYFNNSRSAVAWTVDSRHDVSSLFLNFQYHLHSQSFFMSYNKKTFNSKAFDNFWEKYYPSNERRHAINRGEIMLSRRLQLEGFQVAHYYSSIFLRNLAIDNELSFEERKSAYGNLDVTSMRRREYLPDYYFIQTLMESSNSVNVSHVLGAYLTRVAGAPLKLDLLKTGHATTYGIFTALTAQLTEDEARKVLMYIESGGSWASRKGLRAMWASRGLIN